MTAQETVRIAAGPFAGTTGTLVFRYHDGSAHVNIDGVVHDIPYHDMPPAFDAYAWPGGYPIAYYPLGDNGDVCGIVLCPDCAKAEYDAWEPDEWNPKPPRFHAEIEEEVHDTIYCDGCNEPFIFQDWCDFCQESVETDAEHPFHDCKPLKWSATVHWTSGRPDVRRFATRQQARDLKRSYESSYLRRDGVRVTVGRIDPPIMPDR